MPKHFPHLLDPTIYPDFTRRHVRVPTWETFDNTTQFTTLRGFASEAGRLAEFREELDTYVDRFGLGRVIWPTFDTVFQDNFWELVAEIKRRRLYLFDIWGHVPGSPMEGMWSHVMPPEGMVQRLVEQMGDRFLGFDNGEQDGRYIGGYAPQQCPAAQDRLAQYLNFQRHFQRLCDDLGNHMSALVSLCFGHYYVKEGNHVLLGAETAQALPNSQLYYAFIRGACKQYGLHWFGNASCFNRWGYKNYVPDTTTPDGEGQSRCGPTFGASLSLLRRLIYTHILYNSVAVGFELGYLTTHKEFAVAGFDATDQEQTPPHLSPIGAMQAEAARFLERNGQPGVMHCPVALLLDHFAGWAPPRHLYTSAVFRVWGAMPYGAGDYLTHAVLGQIYPGYEDASYYHDERGFLSPTPYGDIADCILSDIPLWVLRQYGLVIAAGELDADLELRDKLTAFVTQGGELVVTAANAAKLWPQWHIAEPVKLPAGSRIACSDGRQWQEPNGLSLCPIQPPEKAEVWARCGELPAVVRVPIGEGNVCLLLSPFGLNDEPLTEGDPYPTGDSVDKPLASPFLLAEHVRAALDDCLRRQQLFSVGNGLGFVACRKSEGQYTVGVFNNGLSARTMEIAFHAGEILDVEEMAIKDQVVKNAPGYWPTDFQGNDGGASDEQNIAGGDTRIFRVRVREQQLTLLPPPSPPPRPNGRMLAIHGTDGLKEAILARPTFFQHFDGVKIDWSYLHTRDVEQLRREAGWLARQKLRIAVDFSSGLNFYPGLTLLDTLAFRYEESLAAIGGVLDKMPALGASAAIISLHRLPENHCPRQRGEERFRACVGPLCDRAAERDITLMLQHHPHKHRPGAAATLEFMDALGRGNLSFALNLAHLLQCGEDLAETLALAADRLGAVLLSAPVTDLFSQPYDAHAPVHTADADLSPLAALTVPQILDARYTSWDEVYQDLRALGWTQCLCRSAPSPRSCGGPARPTRPCSAAPPPQEAS